MSGKTTYAPNSGQVDEPQLENPFDAFLSEFEENKNSLWRREDDMKVCPQCEAFNELTASKCEDCNWTPYYAE
jgi:ribosomal protein L40E